MLDRSDSNLKRSLVLVSAYTSVDEEMAVSGYYHWFWYYVSKGQYVHAEAKFMCMLTYD